MLITGQTAMEDECRVLPPETPAAVPVATFEPLVEELIYEDFTDLWHLNESSVI